MKGLGLAGAGLGAAAAAAPVFHDLDEVVSSVPAYTKIHPWWVKERELKDPAFEIDWSKKERMSQTLHCFSGPAHVRAVGQAEVDRRNRVAAERRNQWVQQNRPGYSLRDLTLYAASGFGHTLWGTQGYFVAPDFLSTSPAFPVPKPEAYGVSRWQATPEENLRMLRAALRMYGGRDLGVIPIDQDTQKIIYWIERDFKPYVFENVPKGYETGPVYLGQIDNMMHQYDNYDPTSPETHYSNMKYKRVIPNSKQMYIVAWNSQESPELHKHGDTATGATSYSIAYADGREQINRLKLFIEGIGYEALGQVVWNDLCASHVANVFAGTAEQARMGITNVSPTFGSGTRVWTLLTDLPLEPTHPIDAGIFKFCHSCKICSDACPSEALSKETEPSWEPSAPDNSRPGAKCYWWNGPACYGWWREGAQACYICNGVCPFLSRGKAHIHDLIKGTVAITPIFNSFFANMERTFGFGYRKDGYLGTDNLGANIEEHHSFWDLELPEKGFDSSRNVRGY